MTTTAADPTARAAGDGGSPAILLELVGLDGRELPAQGTTIQVTTQYVGEAAQCDAVGVMDAGRRVWSKRRMAASGSGS